VQGVAAVCRGKRSTALQQLFEVCLAPVSDTKAAAAAANGAEQSSSSSSSSDGEQHSRSMNREGLCRLFTAAYAAGQAGELVTLHCFSYDTCCTAALQYAVHHTTARPCHNTVFVSMLMTCDYNYMLCVAPSISLFLQLGD
jgi:hypothetical protein